MKHIKIIIPIILVIFLLIGCTEERILERISLVTLIGYDKGEDHEVSSTALIREVNPDLQSNIIVQSETEETSKGARTKIDMKSAKRLMSGQLRVVLFSEDLARFGLDEPIDTLAMNSELSTSVYLAVVRGDTKSMLEYQYQNITDIGLYLLNLMQHNIDQHQSVSSTLHEVTRRKYSLYEDVSMPILKRKGEFIGIDGVAFFKNAKMVGELPANDIYFILMLLNNFEGGTLDLELSSENIAPEAESETIRVAIDSLISKKKIHLTNPDPAEFDVTINLKCRLLEITSSIPIGDPKMIEKIEKAMGKKIQEEIEQVLSYSQQIDSDIFGFGEIYHSQKRGSNMTQEEWSKAYSNMKASVHVNLEIIRNGVFE